MVVFINDSKKINVSFVKEEVLRGSSVLKAPFLVRYVVSLSTAFVPKKHLWYLPYIVLVNYAEKPAFLCYSGFTCGDTFASSQSVNVRTTSTNITYHVLLCSGTNWTVTGTKGYRKSPHSSRVYPIMFHYKSNKECTTYFLPFLTTDTLTVSFTTF